MRCVKGSVWIGFGVDNAFFKKDFREVFIGMFS